MPIRELFLSAIIQVLFDRIASKPFLNFFQHGGLDKSRLSYLETVRLMLQPVLDNAEEKQFSDGRVKEWLHRLNAASAAVCDFVSSPFNSFEKEVASRLDEIIQMLDNMAKQIPVLGLKESAPLRTASQTRLTTSLLKESEVYGREEEKDHIIQLPLSQENEQGKAMGGVAIVGMGEMGKTTLARLVYKDDQLQLKARFDLKFWIYVSNDFDVVGATRSTLGEVTCEPCYLHSLETMQGELSEKLKGNKFLVVLDDVWSERIEDWELLCCPFKARAQGSKIIVATRNEGVADIMGGFPKVRLHKLSKEDGWSLLSRDDFDRFMALSKAKSMQTFLPLGSLYQYRQDYLSDRVPREILPALGALRVLSLACYKIIELPIAIGDLK
ncbi:hypothetical protein Ancab_022117 [Ancistrocladus abbreviatus]